MKHSLSMSKIQKYTNLITGEINFVVENTSLLKFSKLKPTKVCHQRINYIKVENQIFVA